MTLAELMRRMTHREYKIWQTYLANRWNRPSLSDHYLMQVSAELQMNRTEKYCSIEDKKIQFGKVQEDELDQSDETKQERDKRVSDISRNMLLARIKKQGENHGG